MWCDKHWRYCKGKNMKNKHRKECREFDIKCTNHEKWLKEQQEGN